MAEVGFENFTAGLTACAEPATAGAAAAVVQAPAPRLHREWSIDLPLTEGVFNQATCSLC